MTWPASQLAVLVLLRPAEQLAGLPLFMPLHVQLKGPAPDTAEAVPTLHRFVAGALVNDPPLDEPQTPLAT
jgi:hypothetical protein